MNAECLTCKEYASSLNSVAALAVMRAINAALEFGTGRISTSDVEATADLQPSTVTPSFGTRLLVKVDLRMDTNATDEAMITELLVFLATALRPVRLKGLWISGAEIRKSASNYHLSLHLLKKVNTQHCWHVLFPAKVIAYHALVQLRDHHTLSLEADLSLLMDLSGINVPVLEDGGLTFHGVYTILVPISRDEENRTQWHLLYVDPEREDVLKLREELLLSQIPDARLLISDVQEFEKGSHFLGWTESTIITLRTKKQRYSTLQSSTARVKEKEVVDSSTTLNLNLSFHGFGGSVSHTRKLGGTERNPFDIRERSLRNWLVSSKREQVLLHRPSRLQLWLVPKPAILLHCAFTYMWDLNYEDPTFNCDWRQYLVSSGTQQEAYDALVRLTTDEASTSITMSSLYSDRRDASARTRDLGKAPWSEAITTLLHMMSAISRRSKVGRLNKKVLGFELYDLINQPQWFNLKESHVANTAYGSLGGWPRLLGDVPLVLFFEGLNDPIISKHKQRMPNCSNQPRIAEDQNLLATTIGTLQDLARRRGGIHKDGQITETGYWHSPGDYGMFDDCSHQDQDCASGKCDARQFIWPKPGTPPLPHELKDLERGVIFAADTGSGLFASFIS
jgi:hypothetical protein